MKGKPDTSTDTRAPEVLREHFLELEGPIVGSIKVSVPEAGRGKELFAGVLREGVLRAAGRTTVDDPGEVLFVLKGMERGRVLEEGDYEVRLCLNHDELESFFPSFGDDYLVAAWTIDKVRRKQSLAIRNGEWRRRELSDAANLVTVRYHHPGEEYEGVELWSWDGYEQRSAEEQSLYPVGRDDYGLVFQLDRELYGKDDQRDRIGLLPRYHGDWDKKDGADRFWRPELGSDVYLKAGKSMLWGENPGTALELAAAYWDGDREVVIELSRGVDEDTAREFEIILVGESGDERVLQLDDDSFDEGDELRVFLSYSVGEAIQDGSTYTLRCDQLEGEGVLTPRRILDDPERYASDEALGVEYDPRKSVFRVFAPMARVAEVVLYDQASGDEGRIVHAMELMENGIWEGTVEGDLEGRYYVYRFEGPNQFLENEAVDIYATNTVNSGRRARITDLARTDPPDWNGSKAGPSLASPVDAVIYEMHVRDFTIAENSGVSGVNRGKYLGWTEAGTRLPDDRVTKTGLDHLVELGVTHVQLMPPQDFENDEARGRYNWGYITNGFNSPEGMYASDLNDASRIRELKALIAALHERGIGVIFDVVYNHTGHNAHFNRHVPEYYYRLNGDRSYANGSGCGNDFRTESPMGRRFILDSLKYWVEEYGVDGFRFDLMALMDRETMRQVDEELRELKPDILLYGEPWSAAESPIDGERTDKEGISGTRLGAFNDDFRNALKGAPDGSEPGFIQTGVERDGVIEGIMGQQDWAPSPEQTINYLTCHDNLVLRDKIEAALPEASEDEVKEMMKLGYLVLFTAQGVPFIHGGEEFMRTKFGNHNSYDAPDEINQVDWALKGKHVDLFEYVRDLIALRKAHPMFRLRDRDEINRRVEVVPHDWRDTIMFTIDGEKLEGEEWGAACVLINGSADETASFDLPEGTWRVAFGESGLESLPESVEGSIRLSPKRGIVLYRD
ncbi:MAG: type I pullulanase [Verrucomicrobiota bacterium]